MSAVGATKWFHGRTLQQFQAPEEEDQLVLRRYPLVFVEEVRGLSGAAFFSCWTNIATLVVNDMTGMKPIPGYPLSGTMLPFMPLPDGQPQGYIHPHPGKPDDVDHPSVCSWRVQRDGSVTLSTMGIIASNSRKLETPCELKCIIQGNSPGNATSSHAVLSPWEPLNSWIRAFHGEAHAICTIISNKRMAGVILHRVWRSDSFIRAGVFDYEPHVCQMQTGSSDPIDPGCVTLRKVNWRVL